MRHIVAINWIPMVLCGLILELSLRVAIRLMSGLMSTGKFPFPVCSIILIYLSRSNCSNFELILCFRVFPIPDGLATEKAAPMLCAGLTAYSPLVRNGCGPGKKVGIVGMGGIGHFGLMFAKALGAEVWAISRSHAKEADALKMGADGFIATADKDWNEPHIMTFDLIINTASGSEGFDLDRYLSLLDVHGRWVSVGLPEGSGVEVKAQTFLKNGCLFGASHLGSRKEVLAMLKLAVEKGVSSWVETIPISAEGLKTALTRLHNNDVRYRFTMVDYDKCFPA